MTATGQVAHAGDIVETFPADGIPSWLHSDDPEARAAVHAAMRAARAKFARMIQRTCPFGNCRVLLDPLDGTIEPFFGLAGCGCDMLPGWRSRHYDGLPKPGWTVKPVGRHGSRIAASRRKHARHARWLKRICA